MMPVNLRDLIERISHERYMGVLIYGEANVGKTLYLNKFLRIHKDLNILYIDVQQKIIKEGDTQIVLDLTPRNFLEWCLPLMSSEKLEKLSAVIIDNFDFLVNLWDDRQQTEFVARIQRLEEAVFPKPVLFVLQVGDVFENAYNNHREKELRRIIQFGILEAI